MPTIELHGFAEHEVDGVAAEAGRLAAGTDFAEHVVLVRGLHTTVVDLDGVSRPFLRILTRSAERARVLREKLGRLADIEVVFIEFYERATGDGGPGI